jgi:alpha-N-acetylglucosaminidase
MQENFLLGTFLSDSQQWANDSVTAANRQYNARNQITLWGPNGEINDYAAKNGWSGLVSDYYGGRWSVHHSYIVPAVQKGVIPDWNAYAASLFQFETAWNADNNTYPTTPTGNTLEAVQNFLQKYATGNSAGYTVLNNTDAVGTHVDIVQAWNTDVNVLMYLCDLDPACEG